MTGLLVAVLLAGPLRWAPAEWALEEDLCIHNLCGRYIDAQSGAVVSYVVSDVELPWEEPCEVPPLARGFYGVIDGYRYCGFDAESAREVELGELARLAPDLLPHVGNPSRVELSPEGASLVRVTFVRGNTTVRFSSSVCEPRQLRAVRRLLLQEYRLHQAR